MKWHGFLFVTNQDGTHTHTHTRLLHMASRITLLSKYSHFCARLFINHAPLSYSAVDGCYRLRPTESLERAVEANKKARRHHGVSIGENVASEPNILTCFMYTKCTRNRTGCFETHQAGWGCEPRHIHASNAVLRLSLVFLAVVPCAPRPSSRLPPLLILKGFKGCRSGGMPWRML